MNSNEIFIQATRSQFRFESPKGLLTTEDLWSLPLTSNTGKANLDQIAQDLHAQLNSARDRVSFVTPQASSDKDLVQARFDVVKYIIDVRIAERDEAAKAAEKKATKQRILELIAEKKDDNLKGKSLEELTALANSL